MSFTPGPWRVTEYRRGWQIGSSEKMGVCSIYRNTEPEYQGYQDENARLIAAAPDLLAACQMEEIMADYKAQSSWSDQSIQFFRRLGEMATTHGWDGNDTPLSEFVRGFRRDAIDAAIKETADDPD